MVNYWKNKHIGKQTQIYYRLKSIQKQMSDFLAPEAILRLDEILL